MIIINISDFLYNKLYIIFFAPVAQLDRAPDYGTDDDFLKFMDKLKNYPLVFHLTTIGPEIANAI